MLPSGVHGEQLAYVVGCQSWGIGGKYVQFMGDSQQSTPLSFEPCWDEACPGDRGFTLRIVEGTECDFSAADPETCYVAAMSCCFWVGLNEAYEELCDGQPSPPYLDCWEGEETCGWNDYCGTIWQVNGFNVGPGDETQGCWELEFVCDPEESCEDDVSFCDAVHYWWVDCAP